MIHRLDAAFERDQCSYFNPDVKFGGPNPDPNMVGKVKAKNPNAKNPTKSRRLRRQADKEDEDCEIDDDECNEAALDGIDQCDEDDKREFLTNLFTHEILQLHSDSLHAILFI